MKKVKVLIGPPASGKSTFTKSFANAKVLSSDEMREELGLSPKVREDNNALFKEYYKRFLDLLKEDGDSEIILDSTNISTKTRYPIWETVKRARKQGIEVDVEAFVLTSSIDTLMENDTKRERQVGKDVILKLLKGFNAPHFEEGFSDITILKNSPKDTIDTEFVEAVIELQGFNQYNPHHTDTVGGHTATAIEVAMENSYDYNIVTALIFHDMGKIYTQSFDEDGIAHYYNHENVSSYLQLYFNTDAINKKDLLYISLLIEKHMLDLSKANKAKSTLTNKFPSRNVISDLDKVQFCDRKRD